MQLKLPCLILSRHICTAHHRVPTKGGLVCEGASAEATHVGFLPGVDALVPLEGVELGELLVAIFTAVRTLT